MNAAEIGDVLARLNAGLNTASFIFLVTGFIQIKNKRRRAHEICMKLAFVASAVFLASYLTRYAITGAHHLAGEGWVKIVYYTILFSHMALAAATVPLVFRTLYLARKGRFADHRKIARITYPVWTYVSVTGVVVYVMLYHAVGTVESRVARLTAPAAAPSVPQP
jgi:putative membrane protein